MLGGTECCCTGRTDPGMQQRVCDRFGIYTATTVAAECVQPDAEPSGSLQGHGRHAEQHRPPSNRCQCIGQWRIWECKRASPHVLERRCESKGPERKCGRMWFDVYVCIGDVCWVNVLRGSLVGTCVCWLLSFPPIDIPSSVRSLSRSELLLTHTHVRAHSSSSCCSSIRHPSLILSIALYEYHPHQDSRWTSQVLQLCIDFSIMMTCGWSKWVLSMERVGGNAITKHDCITNIKLHHRCPCDLVQSIMHRLT